MTDKSILSSIFTEERQELQVTDLDAHLKAGSRAQRRLNHSFIPRCVAMGDAPFAYTSTTKFVVFDS